MSPTCHTKETLSFRDSMARLVSTALPFSPYPQSPSTDTLNGRSLPAAGALWKRKTLDVEKGAAPPAAH